MSRAALQYAPQNSRASAGTATSLRIGPAHDAYEHEADQAAEKVTSGENQRVAWSLSRVGLGPVQRECSCGGTCNDCKKKRETMQRQPASSAPTGGHAPASVERVLSRPGSALDGGTRSFMESRFGYDFSRVRIHTDSQAAESARDVSANAYTVGQSIVFSHGKYQPQMLSGRKLLAHELAHVVQQTRGGQQRLPDASSPLERDATHAADQIGRGVSRVRVNGASATGIAREPQGGEPKPPFEVTAADLDHMESVMNDLAAKLDPETLGILVKDKTLAIGLALDSDGDATLVWSTSGDWINPALRKATTELGLARFETGEGKRPRGAAGAPGDAEQRMVEAAEQRDFVVKAMVVSRKVCPDCALAIGHHEHGPIQVRLVKLTAPSGSAGAAGPANAAKGPSDATTTKGPDSPASDSVQVGTKIEVTNSVKNPDGSAVSDVEYNFTENLEQLNHSAPPAGKIPARITIRVTQNAEGAIISVESLSGQPQGLAEALARRTLSPSALANETRGVAAAAGPSPLLTRGLKIGGWAAFAVITGYQLIEATPDKRLQVAAHAGAGLAGGALSTYLVCNAALDLETAGWGLLICGFIAGGVGTAYGGALAGAAYGEEGGSELENAIHRLDTKSANEKTLFNLLVGRMGDSSGCIDAGFVNGFLTEVPSRLEDAEVVLIASQLATMAVVPAAGGAPAQKSHQQAPGSSNALPMGPKGTECPGSGCHGRSTESLQPGIPRMDKKTLESFAAAPTCDAIRSSAQQALRTAASKLPRFYRAPGDIAHHPDVDVPAAPRRATTDPNAFPSEQEQRGTGKCPGGNCHSTSTDESMHPHIDPNAPLSRNDRRAVAAWTQQPKQPTPTVGNTHATPPGTKLAPAASHDLPSIAEQQGSGCPTGNCHPSPTNKDPLKLGSLELGTNGQLTDVDRKRALELFYEQK